MTAKLVTAALLFAALLCSVVIVRPFQNTPDIRSDGAGYHIWVHAFSHGDFTFCEYKVFLEPVGAISGESSDGRRCRNKYPPGVGLIQLPFSWPFLAEDVNKTGFSKGENRVVLWGGGILLFATAVLMSTILIRRGITVDVTLVSVAAFVFGTGLFHYGTYDASFSHIYSAFGATLSFWLVTGRQQLSLGRLAAFALVAAWLYTVRQTNAALSLAVVYVFVRQAYGRDRWRLLGAWIVGTGVAGLSLMAYGRYAMGETSFSSYGSEGFPSFAAHSVDVLVSYERGLFSYYPVFLIALLLSLKDWRRPTNQVFLALVAIFTLLYGSWHAWHLGAGFGHRGFVELAPFGMIALGDTLAVLPSRARRVCIVVVGICCMATVFALSAYWDGDLPFNRAIGADYWRSVSPVSLFHKKQNVYSEQEVRNVHLRFLGAEGGEDGRWTAHLMISNENQDTWLHRGAGSNPGLRISWRVTDSQSGLHDGWDGRQDLPVLAPEESREVAVIVPAPDDSNEDQRLQFSIVQDGVFWAYDIGVPPLSVGWVDDRAASLNKME